MEDLSLDDLLSGLQAAQEKKVESRLSERNVVDLVESLRRQGLLGDDLFAGSSGREFVTQDRLDADLALEVDRSGRIDVVDLPQVLGVDLPRCEAAARRVAGRGRSVTLDGGALYSAGFFQSLAEDAAESLASAGRLSLPDLARERGLPVGLVSATLKPLVRAEGEAIERRGAEGGGRREGWRGAGSLGPGGPDDGGGGGGGGGGVALVGTLKGDTVFSPALVQLVRAQLRGTLAAARSPVRLAEASRRWGGVAPRAGVAAGSHPAVASRLKLPHELVALLPGLAAELASSGSLRGQLSLADGGTWVPDAHLRQRSEALLEAFRRDGGLSHREVAQAGVAGSGQGIAEWIEAGAPGAVALGTSAHVSTTAVDSAAASLLADLERVGWADGASAADPGAPGPHGAEPSFAPAFLASLSERARRELAAAIADRAARDAPSDAQRVGARCLVAGDLVARAREQATSEAREAGEVEGARLLAEAGGRRAVAGGAGGGPLPGASPGAPPAPPAPLATPVTTKGGKRKGGKGAAVAAAAAASLPGAGSDSDDDWGRKGKGGKKGSKKGGGKGGKGARGGDASTPTPTPGPAAAAPRGSSAGAPPYSSQQDAEARLAKWHKGLRSAGEDGELLAWLASQVRGPATEAFEAAVGDGQARGARLRAEVRERGLRTFLALLTRLELYGRGAEKLFPAPPGKDRGDDGSGDDDGDGDGDGAPSPALLPAHRIACERAILKGPATQALDALLGALAGASGDVAAAERTGATRDLIPSFSPAERAALLSTLPTREREAVGAALETIGRPSTTSLEAACRLREAAEASGVREGGKGGGGAAPSGGELGASAAAALAAEARAAAQRSDPAALLASAVPALVAARLGAVTMVPGRAIAPAVDALAKALDAPEADALRRLHAAVVARLTGGEVGGEPDGLAVDVEAVLAAVERSVE